MSIAKKKARPRLNTARKGSRAEHKSMALLESQGYVCTRAAASKGAWDVIGCRAADVCLCQVKVRDWPDLVEMLRLEEFPCPPGTKKLIHRWRDRAQVPDVREL